MTPASAAQGGARSRGRWTPVLVVSSVDPDHDGEAARRVRRSSLIVGRRRVRNVDVDVE